jgi:lysozyme
MTWKWAELWRAGKLKAAADYLASHYNTAGGVKLPGLVRRRKEEALLFSTGIYTGVSGVLPEGVPRTATESKPAGQDPVVREAQELLTAAGLNPGAIDGWMGEKTKAAVIAYQRAHPHLVADGIIGPATLAQLRRDAAAAREALTKAGSSGAGTAVAAWAAGLPWQWIAAGAVVIALGYVAYRNRDVIARRLNTWCGKTVEV